MDQSHCIYCSFAKDSFQNAVNDEVFIYFPYYIATFEFLE